MAWNQDDLTRLEKSIADGVTSVQYTDRKVDYRSLADMLKIRDLIRRDLGLVAAGGQRILAGFSKGLPTGGFGK